MSQLVSQLHYHKLITICLQLKKQVTLKIITIDTCMELKYDFSLKKWFRYYFRQ